MSRVNTPPSASQPQQQTRPAQTEAVAEYVPFAATESIKLSVRLIKETLAVKTKSGATCDDKQALKFLMLCRSRGLNPWEGDAYLIGFDSKDGPQFSLVTAHQAFLKRAEMHPQYDGMESGVIVQRGGELLYREGDFLEQGDILVGAWATVYRKDRSRPTKRLINLSTFQQPYGRWQKDPAGMIVKVAEADALRSTFPTQMAGMYAAEEIGPREVEATVSQPQAGRVNLRGNGQAALTQTKVETEPAKPTEPWEAPGVMEPYREPVQDQKQETPASERDPGEEG